MADHTRKEGYERRKEALRQERSSFINQYQSLSNFVQPRRGRFDTSDRNKGDRRWTNIINSRATQSLRVSRAGLFAGTMSPARPWFALESQDPDMMEFQPVKVWLHQQEVLIRAIFNSGNLYNMAPVVLGELLLFGTGCMSHVSDFKDVARFYAHTPGSYMISQNERYEVDTMCREYEATVEQLVSQFGLDNVSAQVARQWDKSDYYKWHKVVHFVEPNRNQDDSKPLARFKPFTSVYYEVGGGNKDKFLSESGFDEFPVYAPRWDVTGEDVYGTDCPGMTSLGDIKGLQVEEKRKAQGIDKMVNPPLKGPASLTNVPVSSLPGGLTIFDGQGDSRDALSPIYLVNPDLQHLVADITRVEKRIEEAFFVDMFLAISNAEGVQPRNELELSQRNEERLLQLGPVLERVHQEFLSKLIDRTFNQAVRAGIVSPAPQELQGQELEIKFISSLARAQRAVAVGGIERVAAFVGGLAGAGWEGALTKFDELQAVDEFAQAIGVAPRVIRSDDEVEEIQAQRALLEQRQQMLAMAEQAAKTGKMAADSDMSGDNLLKRIGQAGLTAQNR